MRLVAIAVEALDESRGFLVEHGARGAHAQFAAGEIVDVAEQIELGLVDSRGVAPARRARRGAVQRRSPTSSDMSLLNAEP